MTDIHVGRIENEKEQLVDLCIPEDVQTITTAVLGIRNTGKTHTASVIVEGLLALQRQVVVIDPTDVWHGLKSSKDGKEPGFKIVVLGGAHADLPLVETDGATIADFAIEHGVSIILSLRHLRKGAQRRLVMDFAEQLYHRKGESAHRTPLLVAIDECDTFIPQRVGGAEARMVGAIEDLVRRGRSAGIGVMLISQRAASINKDVLTQIEMLIAHRHTSPQDRKALQEWVKAHDTEGREAEFMESVASLPKGTAWFWSPGWLDMFSRVDVRARRTFDSSATPKAGEVIQPDKVAEVDLELLKEKLTHTIEEARANDPRELKRRIAELEKQVSSVDVEDTEQYRALVTHLNSVEDLLDQANAEVERLKELNGTFIGALQQIKTVAAEIESNVETALIVDAEFSLDESPGKVFKVEKPVDYIDRNRQPTEADKAKAFEGMKAAEALPPKTPSINMQKTHSAPQLSSNGHVSGPQQRILDALGSLASIGVNEADRTLLALFAEASPKSSGYSNNLGSMRTSGYIDYPGGGRVALTEAGRESAGVRKLTKSELHEQIRKLVGEAKWRILEYLISIYPDSISKIELAKEIDVSAKSSGYSNNLGALRSLKMLDYPGAGLVSATDLLFPDGLR